MGMRGLQDWMRSYKNVEATHSYVARASQCPGMRFTALKQRVYNTVDWASLSEGLSNRCYKPPNGDAGSTRLGAVIQECGSNTQLCSQGIPMPGNARPTHPDGDVGATCKNRNVGSNKIYVPGASLCPGMRGQHTRMGMWGLQD